MKTYRDRLHRLYRRYRAILVFTNAVTPDGRLLIDSTVTRIPNMAAVKLRRHAKELYAEVERLVGYYGVVGSLDELERVINEPLERQGTVAFISKFDISRIFTRYERALPIFAQLPLHARVKVDTGAVSTERSLGFYLLDAALFEDMAVLWNAAVEASKVAALPDSTFPQVKRAAAFCRAAARAAFTLIEAYLNGIALDVLLARAVPPEIESKLEEWDKVRSRPFRLSLRDKILQYVKIACEAEHPPIQESNSPAMCTVLNGEKRVRHSLVHPTARLTEEEPTGRELVFFDLPLSEVGEICDAVVALIRQISGTVGPSFGDVTWWVFDRGEDEFFPEATFL